MTDVNNSANNFNGATLGTGRGASGYFYTPTPSAGGPNIVDGKTVTAVYDYDGAAFCIDIEAQSVQAEHGGEAIRAAWGVTDITVSGGELTME